MLGTWEVVVCEERERRKAWHAGTWHRDEVCGGELKERATPGSGTMMVP